MLIGDFARLGQVSVRMLRHYDRIGLLQPHRVNEWTGYRSYDPEQLSVLNRIVALKDLGFSLTEVGRVLADDVTLTELRAMLRPRRAEVEEEMRAAGTRLAAVESRLRLIEKENEMPADYVVKDLPAVRLAAVTATLDLSEMGQRIGPMFDQVRAVIEPLGASLATAIATYEEVEDGMAVVVGYAYPDEALGDLQTVDLPATAAVCGVHVGSMATIGESWQALARWAAETYEFTGPGRELYVRAESEDQADWVTELQQPVRSR